MSLVMCSTFSGVSPTTSSCFLNRRKRYGVVLQTGSARAATRSIRSIRHPVNPCDIFTLAFFVPTVSTRKRNTLPGLKPVIIAVAAVVVIVAVE
jgi:hypothetical protein